MPTVAGYARRMARIPRAIDILVRHPDGLELSVLASELGVPTETLRQDILVYYNLDIPDIGLVPDALEFVGPDGEVADPQTAPIVRIVSARPLSEFGVEYLSADSLVRLHRAARALGALEPDNHDLADAVRILEDSLLPGLEPVTEPTTSASVAGVRVTLLDAVEDLRRVRISYARAWQPGTREADIEPYQMVYTRRGWEVEAGPIDHSLPEDFGQIRTFLVSGIRRAERLPETFRRPGDLEERLRRHRTTTAVRIVVDQSHRWVVERFAERVTVLDEDSDADGSLLLDAFLLPPVRERLGLILVIAGSTAFVMDPPDLREAGRDTARHLLAHHRDVGRETDEGGRPRGGGRHDAGGRVPA